MRNILCGKSPCLGYFACQGWTLKGLPVNEIAKTDGKSLHQPDHAKKFMCCCYVFSIPYGILNLNDEYLFQSWLVCQYKNGISILAAIFQ